MAELKSADQGIDMAVADWNGSCIKVGPRLIHRISVSRSAVEGL
jgi:hypothetical protein